MRTRIHNLALRGGHQRRSRIVTHGYLKRAGARKLPGIFFRVRPFGATGLVVTIFRKIRAVRAARKLPYSRLFSAWMHDVMDDFKPFDRGPLPHPPSERGSRRRVRRVAPALHSLLLIAGAVLGHGSAVATERDGTAAWYSPPASDDSWGTFPGSEGLFSHNPHPYVGPQYPILPDDGSFHPQSLPQDHFSGGHDLGAATPDGFSPPRNPDMPLPPGTVAIPEGIDWEQATPIDLAFPSASQERVGTFGDFFYRGAGRQVPMTWLIGKGDRMGIFTLPLLSDSESSFGWLGYDFGGVIHFFSGPRQTDLPPRLYDLTVALPRRQRLSENWWVDLMFRGGWYTDFRGSARKAFRFPSHAVVYYRSSPDWQWLLGIDYLHRDDVQLLPVFGTLWTPHPNWRVEAVFPKPMVAYRFAGSHWLYLAAEMGGGMWSIERQDGRPDKFTYRDFRLATGVQLGTRRSQLFAELGWALERKLQYRSGTPSYEPPDTIFLRLVSRY